MDVPKVNGQLRQESLHILVSPVPSGDAMDGRGVSKIMETGLISGAIVSSNSSFLADPAECGLDRILFDPASSSGCEDGRVFADV